MADELDKLLKYIIHQYTGREEIKDVERDATSVEDVAVEQRRVLREEETRADTLAAAFREGITRARDAHRAGGDAISLDDRNPVENQIADALISFLVRPGIATSSARQTEPQHYIYTVAVDWDRLATIAARAHVDLHSLIEPPS